MRNIEITDEENIRQNQSYLLFWAQMIGVDNQKIYRL